MTGAANCDIGSEERRDACGAKSIVSCGLGISKLGTRPKGGSPKDNCGWSCQQSVPPRRDQFNSLILNEEFEHIG